MVDKNDPRVERMVKAWLAHAKKEGISTPEQDGRQPEDQDVLTFAVLYLNETYGKTFQLGQIKQLLAQQPATPTTKNNDFLNRIKSIINKKLSPSQKKQLKRELARG